MTTEHDALAAVDAIIDNFGHNRVEAYFAGFAEDATFVFHTSPKRLESRTEYEAVWAEWQRDNAFEVVSCASTDRRIQLFGDLAVFTHSVETVASIDGAAETQLERETIVMQNRDGAWLCVHEHLSGRD
jgi:ketosteroid isomerase-like protein